MKYRVKASREYDIIVTNKRLWRKVFRSFSEGENPQRGNSLKTQSHRRSSEG